MQRNLPLYETHRPQSWNEVVGQSAALKKIEVLRKRGLGGRVYLLTGGSGTGKTTIARLIAKELTLPYATYEMDAQRVSLADVREFDKMCRCKPLGAAYHVWIINEVHNMSSKVVSELQTVLESPHVQRNSTWALTTTCKRVYSHAESAKGQACPGCKTPRKKNSIYVPHEDEQRLMWKLLWYRSAFCWKTWRDIVVELNAENVRTRTGKEVTQKWVIKYWRDAVELLFHRKLSANYRPPNMGDFSLKKIPKLPKNIVENVEIEGRNLADSEN